MISAADFDHVFGPSEEGPLPAAPPPQRPAPKDKRPPAQREDVEAPAYA